MEEERRRRRRRSGRRRSRRRKRRRGRRRKRVGKDVEEFKVLCPSASYQSKTEKLRVELIFSFFEISIIFLAVLRSSTTRSNSLFFPMSSTEFLSLSSKTIRSIKTPR